MADIDIAPQDVDRTGLNPTYMGSLSGGDTYQVLNDGRTVIYFKKGSGGAAVNISFDIAQRVDGQTVADRTVRLPNNQERVVGPFPPGIYNNDDGEVEFTVSNVTNLSIAALRIS